MEFENISLKEGIKLSRDKKHYILMDVREEERYKEGHLENAISCPYGILKECYEQMDGKKIIVYCDFGGQSMMAARHLRKDGFEVYNIIGGVLDTVPFSLIVITPLFISRPPYFYSGQFLLFLCAASACPCPWISCHR